MKIFYTWKYLRVERRQEPLNELKLESSFKPWNRTIENKLDQILELNNVSIGVGNSNFRNSEKE